MFVVDLTFLCWFGCPKFLNKSLMFFLTLLETWKCTIIDPWLRCVKNYKFLLQQYSLKLKD